MSQTTQTKVGEAATAARTYEARAYAASSASSELAPATIRRREPRPQDLQLDVVFCGVCHSDLHQVRNEWQNAMPTAYPCVPGHEIVGRVAKAGSAVRKFKEGDLAAVGCMVDSCRTCAACRDGQEQFCERPATFTYNSPDQHLGGVTYGGYSGSLVVDEAFALRVSDRLDPAGTAPLLCAGITTYSPLRHWNVRSGQTVGVVGIGGLGHMAVKLANAFGARVVVFTTSPGKAEDARLLRGARDHGRRRGDSHPEDQRGLRSVGEERREVPLRRRHGLPQVMTSRFRVASTLARKLEDLGVPPADVLRHAGLPLGLFDQEKILVSTEELFALYRGLRQASPDPAIGIRLGTEPRVERYDPIALAALSARSFRDALSRLSRYKQLTCPEAIDVTEEDRGDRHGGCGPQHARAGERGALRDDAVQPLRDRRSRGREAITVQLVCTAVLSLARERHRVTVYWTAKRSS